MSKSNNHMSVARLLRAGVGVLSISIVLSGCGGEPETAKGTGGATQGVAVKPASAGAAPPAGVGTMGGGQPMTPRPATGTGSLPQ